MHACMHVYTGANHFAFMQMRTSRLRSKQRCSFDKYLCERMIGTFWQICVRICMSVQMCARVCVYVCMYIYTHTHIRTYTHTIALFAVSKPT